MNDDSNSNTSATVLRIAVDEQRRLHDELNQAYQQVKTKILTLVAGGLALLTFLYSGGDTFIPTLTYGKIFYFIGLGLTLGGLSSLLHATRPSGVWEVATEQKELKLLDGREDEIEYLLYIKDRYIACFKNNIKEYNKKLYALNMAFYPLVFGAIILLILNLFRS